MQNIGDAAGINGEALKVDTSYPNVHFEPADHALHASELSALLHRFLDGDLDAHDWNSATVERMASYQPELITSDGAVPLDSPMDFEDNIKIGTWLRLPARPSKLNSSGNVTVVLGDVIDAERGETWRILRDATFYNLAAKLPDDNDRAEIAFSLVAESIIGAGLLGAADSVAYRTLYYNKIGWLAEEELPYNSGVEEREHISRRTLLKCLLLGTAAAGVALGRGFAPNLLSSMRSETAKDRLQPFVTALRPRLLNPEWTNGRTALLIAKHIDAMDFLEMPRSTQGTVIMGNVHAFESEGFMQSAQARDQAIRELAEAAVAAFEHVASKTVVSKEEARRLILNHLAQIDIQHVQDPGDVPQTPKAVSAVVKNVTRVGSFSSPHIAKLLSPLR